jgi:hypothetical protein
MLAGLARGVEETHEALRAQRRGERRHGRGLGAEAERKIVCAGSGG